jgi:membrane peptidoglycan carboxypeptidase
MNHRYRAVIAKLAERHVLTEEQAQLAQNNVPVPDPRLWDPVFGSPVELLQADLDRFAAEGEAVSGIQTSIDPSTQRALHTSMISEMNRVETELGISLDVAGVVVENATGRILGIVTNREADGPNTLNLAKTRHQMGSLIKPFIVVCLAESGDATPALMSRDDGEIIVDMPEGPDWTVHNNGGYIPAREVAMYDALARSLNVWFVGVGASHYGKVTGFFTRVFQFAPPRPSHLLGTGEVNVLDVASAYAMLTTEGWRIQPHVVTSATKADGLIVPEFGRQQIVRDPRAAYLGLRSLVYAVDSPAGTPHGLRQRAELAHFANLGAKTGTTSNGRDLWAVAVTPRITCVVWFGSQGNDRLYSRTSALKAVEETLVRLASSRPEFLNGTFVKPADVVDVEICVREGVLASKNCPEKASWPFYAGTAPTRHCSH